MVNPQFERLTGIPAGEAVGRTARELVKELDPVWIETYDRVVRTGEPMRFEREEPAFGRWFEVQAYPLAGDRFAILYDDITERKRAEAALRDSEARLRGVLDAMAEGFAIFDAEFTIRDVNQETLRLDGRTREELIGRSHWDAFPGTEYSPLGSLYRRVAQERVPRATEYLYDWPDGRTMWIDVRAYPTPDGGVAVFWRDITDRKTAEDAMRDSEERYRALFESMDEAYAVVDVLKDKAGAWIDFRFVEVNPAFLAHTSMPWPVGQTATELLGAPNPRWTQLYGQALDTGKAIRVQEAEPTLDRVFDLNIFTLDRERNRVAVLFTNITERKRAEAALRDSEERFRQFANASASGLWIRNPETLSMEFVSPAIATIYGTARDAH
ncbi:PAS domain S-box protein [Rhizobium sp. Root708]|uniref:PAS domain S-box protein n=1 Tax=Rhizobium sp. Root708 TaxID=1736592 RepID=UPI0019100BE1|nr:PAS domain S-box protein [Rhizobium sp. Root708]